MEVVTPGNRLKIADDTFHSCHQRRQSAGRAQERQIMVKLTISSIPNSGGSGVYILGGSGVAIIAAGARTYIATVNHT